MNIIGVHTVLDSAEPDFIGSADNLATLDAAAGKPHGKAVWVVIASALVAAALHEQAVGYRRPPKIPAPYDQRHFQ